MRIEFKANVWKMPHSSLEYIASGKSMPLITTANMSDVGYTLIGTAEVTATLFSSDKIVQSEIDALKTQLEKERAESQRRQNAILDKISKL